MKKNAMIRLMAVSALLCGMPIRNDAQKVTVVDQDYLGAGTYGQTSNFYWDIDGDGQLEALIYQGVQEYRNGVLVKSAGTRWLKHDGTIALEVTGLNVELSRLTIMDDLNGDGIPDFVYSPDNYSFGIFLSTPDGYTNITSPNVTSVNYYSPCVVDINHDGRKDIVFYRYSNNRYTPAAYIQTADHQFNYQDLEVVTDEAELQNAEFSTGGNGSFTVSSTLSSLSIANGMWAFARRRGDTSTADAVRSVAPLGGEEDSDVVVADINSDGYPDVITTTYPTLLSLPDGRYYAANLAGKVALADLNGDGQKDIVQFNTNEKKVVLHLSQNGEGYETKSLISNGSITAMYCQDFDGDGLTDIMLQAASNDYSFLVFFKNNGSGNFTKKERMLTGHYKFSKPYDFENNGKPSVLGIVVPTNTSADKKYGIRHITWDDSFNLTENKLVVGEDSLWVKGYWNRYQGAYSGENLLVADFDGDGLLDILCHQSDNVSCIYTPCSAPANKVPEQMKAPNVIYDKQSGLAKVEWQTGSDAESATTDLTYTVRIGTTDGGSDLAYYDAGNSRYCVVNTGTWEQVNAYVSVCATDANGKSGEWSPSASFKVETVGDDFTFRCLDMKADYITTGDTIVVHSLSGKRLTYTLPDDGRIIMQQGDSAYIVFGDYGDKTISVTTDNGNVVSHSMTVLPLKRRSFSNNCSRVFDLDGDGLSEGLVSGSLHSFGVGLGGIYIFEDDRYKKLASMFNMDFSASGDYYFIDKTMNGLADIHSPYITKNGSNYQWMLNQGDLDFEMETSKISLGYANGKYYGQFVDLNNDGFMDYVYSNTLYINKGDFTFETKQVPEVVRYLADVDQDGLMDLIAFTSTKTGGYQYLIYRNLGNAEFEQVSEVMVGQWGNVGVYDVNNDGFPDLVAYSGDLSKGTYQACAYLGSKDLAYSERITLPGQPITFDIDNNGYMDYLAKSASMSSRGMAIVMGEEHGYNKIEYSSLGWGDLTTDINNDGTPDINTDGSIYTSIIISDYTNEAPTAPTAVTVNQDDDYVVISWSGATDKETPTAALRYNVSVKVKGASGDGSYIISPMNQTKDEAKTIDVGNHQYRSATRYPIPFSRFRAGTNYEIRVQTIDGWCGHSPFSKVVEFTPTAQSVFTLPDKAGVGQAVPFTLKANTSGTPTISADGGTVEGNTITWTSAGLKSVTLTTGGITSTRQILIKAAPDLSFDIPGKALSGSKLTIRLADGFNREDATVSLTGSNSLNCTVKDNVGYVILPARSGSYDITVVCEDDVFGKVSETRTVEAVDFIPQLTLASATNDGSRLTWSESLGEEVASMLTGNIRIYRETSVTNNYELIAECPITDGTFTDHSADPSVRSYRYQVALPTTYGSESMRSRICNTVLLQANQGQGNDINLHWNRYSGGDVLTYSIYAGTSRNGLQLVDQVSGNTLSYVHHRSSNDLTYYAIEYETSANAARPLATGAERGSNAARSNIIGSNEAYAVTLVESIRLQTREGETELSENQTQLHMQAVVTPALATLARMEWSIIAGDDLAVISSDGLLTITPNRAGGKLTIQARSIDGSNISATMDIAVKPYYVSSPVVVTAQSYTREYGEENPAFEFTVEGGELEGKPEISCEATASSPVGTYAIVIKKGSVTNSNDTYTNGVLTITPAPLKVTAEDASREQFVDNPEFVITYEGWKLGEDERVLKVKPSATTEATKDSPVGVYAIVVSGGEADNYKLNYVNGILTVIESSGIRDIMTSDKPFDIYNIQGHKIRHNATTLDGLPEGVYIINGQKVVK